MLLSEKLHLIKNLFKGRQDVFAVRWEKASATGKRNSGYMPACSFDPYQFKAHKMKGGTFQNFTGKTYLPLTEDEIVKHLDGAQQIGIYPLLPDNTSYFLVADFDDDSWMQDAVKFFKACEVLKIHAYIERSRSGKGAHVWIFFDKAWPAVRSRTLFLSILENTGVFSAFDKSSSFDRLFPNQDYLSGKGLGNLIALPLCKPTWLQGNSCFIAPETGEAFIDQFEFLHNIQKTSVTLLEHHFETIKKVTINPSAKSTCDTLRIVLTNVIHLSRAGMTPPLMSFIKEELSFVNSEFLIRQKSGKSTHGIQRYYKCIEENENEIILPRGFIGKLIRHCRENAIACEFQDQRQLQPAVSFEFGAVLRDFQHKALDLMAKKDFGVIVAPPGSGKTIMALKIIADKQQPALIIVHRKLLLDQWIERIISFLGIPKHEIGFLGKGRNKIGGKITIATIQSLGNLSIHPDDQALHQRFGTIILDECHHIPAETFRTALSKLHTYYLYGLTATPFRKFNDGKLIFIHLGDIIGEIKPEEIKPSRHPRIIIQNTAFDIPFNPLTDQFETLSKILVHDAARNRQIAFDVSSEISKGQKVVIITERKDHIDALHHLLKNKFETITLSGEDSASARKVKWEWLKSGNFQVLITTGQFLGEGTDMPLASCLLLVYPFSFQGKLIQYLGRVQRSEINPTIYDYRDIKVSWLNNLFLKRNAYYRKIQKFATLFDEPDELKQESPVSTVEKEIKVALKDLEFRYGSVAFDWHVVEIETDLTIEIENQELRPEFKVLKPFFAKVIKSEKVKVKITAEIENGKLVSLTTESKDIEKLNREIIDGLKFSFIAKNILLQPHKLTTQLPDIQQLQGKEGNALYDSGENLLDDILRNGNYRHQLPLHYLSKHHLRSLMKLRFMLQPFSFVFLLSGKTRFYLILETLDTEEATYIWHFPKDKNILKSSLKEIDNTLGFIRNHGRHAFLAQQPPNFSRILHDYTDQQKGYIIWKNSLEQQMI